MHSWGIGAGGALLFRTRRRMLASSAACSANMIEVLVHWGVCDPELRYAA